MCHSPEIGSQPIWQDAIDGLYAFVLIVEHSENPGRDHQQAEQEAESGQQTKNPSDRSRDEVHSVLREVVLYSGRSCLQPALEENTHGLRPGMRPFGELVEVSTYLIRVRQVLHKTLYLPYHGWYEQGEKDPDKGDLAEDDQQYGQPAW